MPNPVSGVPAPKKDGSGLSLRCDRSVTVFRHVIAEFDKLPLDHQLALLWGWGLESISAVTFSGHRSLHALFRVDVPSLGYWDSDIRRGLFPQVLMPLGCDPSCANPGHLSRLAGAWRDPAAERKWKDKEAADIPPAARQELFFVREALT